MLKNTPPKDPPKRARPWRRRGVNPLEFEFREHLKDTGVNAHTRQLYMTAVRRFLEHIGSTPIERLTEEITRSFFNGIQGHHRKEYARVVWRFLTFAAARLPVPINARGAESPRAPAPTKKELALRQKWTLDKLVEQKEDADDLIAKLARKVIDHYLYFQGRIKGEPENLDDIGRFADECRDLIETHLSLFMKLSAEGRNIHSIIDERVQI